MSCPLGSTGCIGGSSVNDLLCAKGYVGPLCGSCDNGYYSSNNQCHLCGSTSFDPSQLAALILILIFASFFLLGGYFLLNNENLLEVVANCLPPSLKVKKRVKDFKQYLKGFAIKFKIMIATYQVVTSTASVFNVSLPNNFTKFTGVLSFMNLNLSQLIPIECMWKVNFYDRLQWTTLAPLGLLVVLGIGCLFELLILSIERMQREKAKQIIDTNERNLFVEDVDSQERNYEGDEAFIEASIHPQAISNSQDIGHEIVLENTDENGSQRSPIRKDPIVAHVDVDKSHEPDVDESDDAHCAEDKKTEIKSRYLNYVFYLTYLVLPSVTTTIFQLYLCTNVDPNEEDNDTQDWFLTSDLSIACYTPLYYKWTVFGYFMIAIYPVGIPLLYWMFLYSCRKEIAERHLHSNDDDSQMGLDIQKRFNGIIPMSSDKLLNSSIESENNDDESLKIDSTNQCLVGETLMKDDSHNNEESINIGYSNKLHLRRSGSIKVRRMLGKMSPTAQRLSFLWLAYKPHCWYWEIIEAFRRILLTAVLGVCATGTAKQSILGIILAYAINKIYGYVQPFASSSDMHVSEVGQIQIFITYLATLIITRNLLDNAWDEWIGGLMVACNLAVILAGFYNDAWENVGQQVVATVNSYCVNKLRSLKIYRHNAPMNKISKVVPCDEIIEEDHDSDKE